MIKIEFGFGIEFRGDGVAILLHEQEAGVNEILRRTVDLFGGYTNFKTLGAWRDPDTKLIVKESGCTVSVLTSDTQHNLDERICDLVQQIKTSLQQKAVAVTYTKVETTIH